MDAAQDSPEGMELDRLTGLVYEYENRCFGSGGDLTAYELDIPEDLKMRVQEIAVRKGITFEQFIVICLRMGVKTQEIVEEFFKERAQGRRTTAAEIQALLGKPGDHS